VKASVLVSDISGHPGIDLSKILANTNPLGENVVKTDKCIGVSKFMGGGRSAAPTLYA